MNTPPLHQRLYLRIWLAVVFAVVVLTLVAGWLGRQEAERERAQRPGREITIRSPGGDILGQARARPNLVPGQGAEFQVAMNDGSMLLVQFSRPPRSGPGAAEAGGPMGGAIGGAGGGPGMRTQALPRLPFDFVWMLVILAVAVALGSYPIVRRLTKRLELVQQGVERWGRGDLSTRLSEDGKDEVAFLAQRFNHSAERIETLLEAQKALVASQQTLLASQKTLLANASHELRSPLTRIRMGIELMTSAQATEAPMLAEIKRNISELDQLIEEILLASRLDAQEADMGTVEAVDLMGLAAEECARANADLDVKLSAHASGRGGADPAATELVVQGVSKLLRRALRNLLENARRYGAGSTSVTLEHSADMALIRVCDNGPGIPDAFKERVFEAFFRLPGASEREGGVGLGLALVKSIAARHGGTVACEDRPGGGACFLLRLPMVEKIDTASVNTPARK